jgi:hypothetical protein
MSDELDTVVSHEKLAKTARTLHSIYEQGCAFPEWSIDLLGCGDLASYAGETRVYYDKREKFEDVEKMVYCREPCNIAMNRLYDEAKLSQKFGYTIGAYAESNEKKLMPNISIYCKTPIRANGQQKDIHVINVVGYAFDSTEQPDYRYFFTGGAVDLDKMQELVDKMKVMWNFCFQCAKDLGLKRIYIADVGGGAFSTYLNRSPETQYATLKEQSLGPVARAYPNIETSRLGMVPHAIFSGEMSTEDSLFVNAWDPWSMVGNGNAADNSLDGFFGRCTAMAVLCWPPLNPSIRYLDVELSESIELE